MGGAIKRYRITKNKENEKKKIKKIFRYLQIFFKKNFIIIELKTKNTKINEEKWSELVFLNTPFIDFLNGLMIQFPKSIVL